MVQLVMSSDLGVLIRKLSRIKSVFSERFLTLNEVFAK